jgi:hypothetical protein
MKESPAPASLVRELHVASDYGQIYIYDPETQQDEWADVYDEESSSIFRAMDDASESRRFVGYAKGMVDVLTPSQYNWKAPMRVELCDAPPPLDADEWDHVVEVPLPVPSGTLCFLASGGGERSRPRSLPGRTGHGSRDVATWLASGRSRARELSPPALARRGDGSGLDQVLERLRRNAARRVAAARPNGQSFARVVG